VAFPNAAKGLKNHAITGLEPHAQIPELAERGRKRATQFFRRLDVQLAENTFVAGERYSIADISALVVTDFAARAKIALPDDADNLQRWHATVSSRPSAAV